MMLSLLITKNFFIFFFRVVATIIRTIPAIYSHDAESKKETKIITSTNTSMKMND